MKKNLICGKQSCLLAYQQNIPILELWLQSKEVRKDYQPLLAYCQENKIAIKYLSKDEMSKQLHCDSHQGIAIWLKDLPFLNLEEALKKESEPSLVLMLDSIYDPQNLGAIFRVAEVFQADGVVWSKNRGADLSPSVHKSSVGASVMVNKVVVANLVDTLLKAKKAGYWVICASVSSASQNVMDFSFPEKTLLVLGSEGKGVQKSIEKHADFLLYLPMKGRIDSLNVSQAAACMSLCYRRQYP